MQGLGFKQLHMWTMDCVRLVHHRLSFDTSVHAIHRFLERATNVDHECKGLLEEVHVVFGC
jgi:hypothetical protein